MEQFNKTGMKLKSLALAVSLSFSWSVEAQTLEFKSCVEKTLSQNPEMAVSASRIQQAKSALKEATNSRLPQITASLTASNSDNPLNVFGMKLQQRQAALADFGFDSATAAAFGSGDFAYQPSALNHPDAHTDFNTRLEMLIPVYNGGKISAYQEQAKAMIKAAESGDVAVKQFLTFNVYQAYEAVHTARAYIDVAEKAVLASDSYVKTTSNLVDEGILVRSELLSAQVNQSNARMALEKAKNSEIVALESLKMLMALEPSAQIDVGHRVDVSLPVENVDDLIAMALASNPGLEAKRNEVNSSFAAVGVSKSGLYPSFNLMARQDWNDEQLGFESSSYTVAGVVSWKITDFGVTASGVDKANAAAKMKQSELRSKENQLRLEIIKAWHALEIDKKQVHVNQLAAQQAEEAQRLILKRYKNGVATITEVLAGQALLDKARAEVVAATYDRNIQAAKLRLNTGTMSLAQL
ncbi:TolC family protein [Thiomicrorhabdus sp. ZW0627]|uniref:TolC family protein n=1 Tax=Thiomicrorhabdus sp. ZW0627 TaxID=3039774 RepID=UPI0024363056|nr:TolC family protein [Thiomicrorhabdus sp. ZW0627]MDG6774892.1 TolC family protein [Thiomicrorhabdus sp. ZW0627]